MVRVFIADDHRVLLDGLRVLIEAEHDLNLVGTAVSGEEVIEKLKEAPADVLLLDINLPGMSGIETCKAVIKKFPGTRVIGLSTFDKGSIIRKMLKSGALGFVLKNAGSDELLKAIRTVAAGERHIDSLTNKVLLDEMSGIAQQRVDFIPELTKREKQVLALIVKEYTTQEIADKLFISINTAETYRKNLLHKLNARNSAGLVRIAIERGLVE